MPLPLHEGCPGLFQRSLENPWERAEASRDLTAELSQHEVPELRGPAELLRAEWDPSQQGKCCPLSQIQVSSSALCQTLCASSSSLSLPLWLPLLLILSHPAFPLSLRPHFVALPSPPASPHSSFSPFPCPLLFPPIPCPTFRSLRTADTCRDPHTCVPGLDHHAELQLGSYRRISAFCPKSFLNSPLL